MPNWIDDAEAGLALPAQLGLAGSSVSITPPGGATIALTGVLGALETEELQGAGGIRRDLTRTLTIARDPDGSYGGIAEFNESSAILIDGQEWRCLRIEARSAAAVRLRIGLSAAADRTRQSYRQPGLR